MENNSTPQFFLQVDGITGVCPVGEKRGRENIDRKAIPVFSCEGPCIRGEIARLAANMVAKEAPYDRACYGEAAMVPYSSMARWVKQSDRIVMIDGCFLTCMGRLVNNLVDREKIVHIDALRLHKKYSDLFLIDDVPEAERRATARLVADRILALLKEKDLARKSQPVTEPV